MMRFVRFAAAVALVTYGMYVANQASRPGISVPLGQAQKITGGIGGGGDHTSATSGNFDDVCSGEQYNGCGGGDCGTSRIYQLSGLGKYALDQSGVCSQKSCNMGSATCGSPNFSGCG
jgi:hypothetical protein